MDIEAWKWLRMPYTWNKLGVAYQLKTPAGTFWWWMWCPFILLYTPPLAPPTLLLSDLSPLSWCVDPFRLWYLSGVFFSFALVPIMLLSLLFWWWELGPPLEIIIPKPLMVPPFSSFAEFILLAMFLLLFWFGSSVTVDGSRRCFPFKLGGG